MCTNTHSVRRSFPRFTQQQTCSFHQHCGQYEDLPMWLSRRDKAKLFQKVIFLDVLSTAEFDPWIQFLFYPPSYQVMGKRERPPQFKTCQLPFTFAKECWQVLTMLSVSAPDKSSQFINKIDGIAYRQFLLRVFPCKSRSQKHPRCLTNSYPVCQSPGMLKALNASCVQLSIHTTAGTIGVFHGWHRKWTVNNQMTL